MAFSTNGVFLAIVSGAVFLPLDGVDGLRCYVCEARADGSNHCMHTNSKTNAVTCPNGQACSKTSTKINDIVAVVRGCTVVEGALRLGECLNLRKSNTEVFVCACDRDCCNSGTGPSIGGGECGSGGDGGGGGGGGDGGGGGGGGTGYLHGAPIFVLGLILLTAVSNLGRQHLN